MSDEITLYKHRVTGKVKEMRIAPRSRDSANPMIYCRGVGSTSWQGWALSVFLEQHEPLPEKAKPGPKPERLKIEGDWRDALRHALRAGPFPKDAK